MGLVSGKGIAGEGACSFASFGEWDWVARFGILSSFHIQRSGAWALLDAAWGPPGSLQARRLACTNGAPLLAGPGLPTIQRVPLERVEGVRGGS